jgi:hypothetical protein
MRISTAALILLAGLPAIVGAGELPFLKPTVSYSGIRVITTPDGDISQKVYWSPEKVRTETEMPGMGMINIVREDLGVMWILSPNGGMCLEQTLAETDAMALAPGAEAYTQDDVDFKEVGTETVDGLDTTKYEVVSTDDSGTSRAVFWVTDDNIPVRMEIEPAPVNGPYHILIRLTDLQTGPLADSLFETGMRCSPMPPMPPGRSPGAP